jgi:hypothetical protein
MEEKQIKICEQQKNPNENVICEMAKNLTSVQKRLIIISLSKDLNSQSYENMPPPAYE